MAEINWGALQTPDFMGNALKAQALGQQNRAQSVKENALKQYGTDPEGAIASLMAVDPEAALQLRKARREEESYKNRQAAGAQIAAGDTAGATKTAAAAGDFDMMGEISKLSKEQREVAKQNAEDHGAYALSLKPIPYADRKAKIMADAPNLLKSGFTQEQLDGFDPTDANLDAQAASAMDLKTALDQASKERDYKLNVDKFDEEKRSHGESEKVARGQLGVAQGQLGIAGARLGVERQRLQFDRESKASAVFDPETIRAMAQQAWQGDKSVFSNLGRGTQGAQNIAALRKEIYAQGALGGKSPADLATMNAEFMGQTSAARTAGTRVGAATVSTEELPGLVQMSAEAYSKLPRTDFKPFNQLEHAVASGTANPAQAAAYTADFAVINAYARAVSPSGQPHIADQKKAADLLSHASGPAEHQAVLNQIVRETAVIKSGATRALHPSGASSDKVITYDAKGNRK